MKWRNQLLALVCLVAFGALGVVYFQHWVIRKPFGIILFVGEGLSPARLAPTRTYAAGAGTRLNMDLMPYAALVMNYSKDFAAPDQAAAATAIATGERVTNRALAVNSDGKPLKNIVELAREHGRAIGLVTDTKLTDLTSAAFYAHTPEPNDTEKIDLLLELRGNGFDIVRTRTDLEAVPAWRRPKLFGIFNNDDLAFANQVGQRGQQPSLSDMVRRAIQLLQYNSGGYLLVVDAGLMRKAAEENNGERTLSQTLELDRAVGIARSYGGEKATIIVCGDVAIGGLKLNGFPFRKDSGIALLGFNSAGQPWITWATGPNGGKSYGAAKIPGKEEENPSKQPQTEQPEPAAFYSKSALVTVEDVVAFGNGPGTDTLQGVVESTAVFNILRGEL